LVIFIGMIGGTLTHGIIGLFIGPIILAVAWELLAAWMREGQEGAVTPMTSEMPGALLQEPTQIEMSAADKSA
jgi:predicted PurR-regulated permease PerM